MKIRLLYTLLVAALVATAAVALGSLPATAEMRTIMVRLDTGQLVPVQVDVPPGTPLEDIEIPVGAGRPGARRGAAPTEPTAPTTPSPERAREHATRTSRSRRAATTARRTTLKTRLRKRTEP